MNHRYSTGDPILDHTYYRWYAGNHCYLKCTPEKCRKCLGRIREMFRNIIPVSHKHFVYLIRGECKICDLPEDYYHRNIYREPLHAKRVLHE